MPGTTVIDPADATGLLNFAQLRICGFQLNTASCVDGAPLTEPVNVLTGCGLDNFNWETETEDDIDIKGKCASYFEKGNPLWCNFEFGFCEEHSTLLEQMTGQHDIMTATDGGTDIMGMMAPDPASNADPCCPNDGACDDTDLHMLIWGWNRCGADFHPEYRFLVLYIPRLDFEINGTGEWQNDNFSEYTWEARALKPRGAIGGGVGGIIPAHYANTRRKYYIIGTNSPPPTCGGCGQCQDTETETEGEGGG